jgi:hypothetical protein
MMLLVPFQAASDGRFFLLFLLVGRKRDDSEFGETDAYVVLDLPDDRSAAAAAMAVNASGRTSEVVVLLTPEDIDAAAKLSVDYRPPDPDGPAAVAEPRDRLPTSQCEGPPAGPFGSRARRASPFVRDDARSMGIQTVVDRASVIEPPFERVVRIALSPR